MSAPGHAELVASTAHNSKGLEWGRVRIATDFTEPLDKKTGESRCPSRPRTPVLQVMSAGRCQSR